MKVLSCEISIGAYKFKAVKSVEIELSNRDLINTAILTLPQSALIANESGTGTAKQTAELFKRGDAITIKLGYDGDNRTEFQGYISKVDPARPTVIECEDSAFLLRDVNIFKSYKSISLKSLLSDVVGSTGLKISDGVPNMTINKVVLDNVSGLDVLAELKKIYGLISYITRENELFCGLAYTDEYNTVNLKTDRNVINNTDLTAIDANAKKVLIKAKSFLPNGTNIEVETGDKGGETRSVFFYGIESQTELKTLAANELEKYKSQKLKGTIDTFIQPQIYNGDTVNYKDIDYPERDGNYYIDAVTVSFGDGGARRKIEIGIKA